MLKKKSSENTFFFDVISIQCMLEQYLKKSLQLHIFIPVRVRVSAKARVKVGERERESYSSFFRFFKTELFILASLELSITLEFN